MWVYSHGSWLIASNTNNSPAQTVITFTKSPYRCCPIADNTLVFNFSQTLQLLNLLHPISPTYLLVSLHVGRMVAVSLNISSTPPLYGQSVRADGMGFCLFWGGFIDYRTIAMLYMVQGMVHLFWTWIRNFSSTAYWKPLLSPLNWLCTVVRDQLSLYGWAYFLPICSAPWASSLSKYQDCASQFLMNATISHKLKAVILFSHRLSQ